MKETIKKSKTLIENAFDILKVCNINIQAFVPCEIVEDTEEGILEYSYDITNLKEVDSIKKLTKSEKFRFMLSIFSLERLYQEYSFHLHPENLYYDVNYRAHVKFRDVKKESDQLLQVSFLDECKALFGYLFSLYSYDEILQGGISLLSKNPICAKMIDMNLNELQNYCYEKLEEESVSNVDVVYLTLKKKKLWKTYTIASSFILIVSIVALGYSFFIARKQSIQEVNALQSFVGAKYVQVIDELEGISTSNLKDDEAYVLAMSYIYTSGLSKDSISSATSQLSLDGDENYTLFWVHLGRNEFEEAYTIANQYLDKRLLYFAYSVELNSLTTNTSMGIEEKDKRTKELTELIDSYIESLPAKEKGGE